MKLWPRLCFYSCLWFCPQGGSPAGRTPQQGDPPAGRTPWQGDPTGKEASSPLARRPPGKETPPGRENSSLAGRPPLWEVGPPGKDAPLARRPPCWGDPPGIQSMSSQYASYWNAFLSLIFPQNYSHTVYFFEHLFAINFTNIIIPSNSSFLSKTGWLWPTFNTLKF